MQPRLALGLVGLRKVPSDASTQQTTMAPPLCAGAVLGVETEKPILALQELLRVVGAEVQMIFQEPRGRSMDLYLEQAGRLPGGSDTWPPSGRTSGRKLGGPKREGAARQGQQSGCCFRVPPCFIGLPRHPAAQRLAEAFPPPSGGAQVQGVSRAGAFGSVCRFCTADEGGARGAPEGGAWTGQQG